MRHMLMTTEMTRLHRLRGTAHWAHSRVHPLRARIMSVQSCSLHISSHSHWLKFEPCPHSIHDHHHRHPCGCCLFTLTSSFHFFAFLLSVFLFPFFHLSDEQQPEFNKKIMENLCDSANNGSEGTHNVLYFTTSARCFVSPDGGSKARWGSVYDHVFRSPLLPLLWSLSLRLTKAREAREGVEGMGQAPPWLALEVEVIAVACQVLLVEACKLWTTSQWSRRCTSLQNLAGKNGRNSMSQRRCSHVGRRKSQAKPPPNWQLSRLTCCEMLRNEIGVLQKGMRPWWRNLQDW